MQFNFVFYLFLSCSLFFLEVVVKLFDYSENQIVCFPSFVLTVFRYSTSYTVIVVLWKRLMGPVNAPALWWPWVRLKCVSGLRRIEITLNFLRCIHVFDQVLKYGSDINGGNWLQLLFYFIVLMGIVTAVIGMSFLSAVFHALDWSFLVLHFDWNVCNWIPNVIWPRMDWFWVFLFENGFLRWLHFCLDWNLQKLLNFYCFWRHQFFRCLGWVLFWSVL